MARLTEAEYKSTMGSPMTLLQPEDPFRAVPLGEYVASIPHVDHEGHDFSDLVVEKVYREPTNRVLHVLIASRTDNVFLVIVVDEPGQSIYGHYLLDLNREYGLR
jgi:hypothetical protein